MLLVVRMSSMLPMGRSVASATCLLHQAERVAPTTPDLIAAFRMEDDVIDSLKRIYSHAKRLAKLLLPPVVAAKEA